MKLRLGVFDVAKLISVFIDIASQRTGSGLITGRVFEVNSRFRGSLLSSQRNALKCVRGRSGLF